MYGASLVELGTMYKNLKNIGAGWYDKRIRTEWPEEQPTERFVNICTDCASE
jgi:hypothetical protein